MFRAPGNARLAHGYAKSAGDGWRGVHRRARRATAAPVNALDAPSAAANAQREVRDGFEQKQEYPASPTNSGEMRALVDEIDATIARLLASERRRQHVNLP